MERDRLAVRETDKKHVGQFVHPLADHARDVIGVVNRNGRLIYVSQSSHEVYGLDPDVLVGQRAFDHAVPEDHSTIWKAFKHAVRTGEPIRFEFRFQRGSERLTMEAHGNPLLGEDGRLNQVLLVIRDITNRKRVEQHLFNQNQLLERIARNEPIAELVQAIQKNLIEETQCICSIEPVDDSVAWIVEPARMPEGDWQPIWSRAVRSSDGRERGIMTVYSELQAVSVEATEQVFESYLNLVGLALTRQFYEQEIRQLAYQDPLTSLPNRRLVNERIEFALHQARENGSSVGLLVLDLDRFKTVNDLFGHPFGDKLLRVVAERLRGSISNKDTLGRIGGDEFIVLVSDAGGVDEVKKIAGDILKAFQVPVRIDTHEFRVTPSIGIAMYPDHGDNRDTIFRNADTAMYAAKRSGRYTYRVYDATMSEELQTRLTMETHLQKALDRNEYEFHFQPRYRIEDGCLTGVEALLRWNHPTLGLVPPAEFIPLAEDTGLILPLGEFVLRSVCQQIADWMQAGISPIRVAANVSGHQLTQGDFAATVKRILRETGADPNWLELEITESAIILQAERSIDEVAELRELGVMVSIDDFGTGYSSLRRLGKLPVDTLKIDRSFVENIPFDRDNLAITDTIIALTRNLGLHVVAEGVETEEQMEALRTLGCTEMQGFLFSRPKPVFEINQMLAASPQATV